MKTQKQGQAQLRTAGAPLCELRELSVRYGERLANEAVSLQIGAGEVVALLGENGAGKSTLLHALYGMVKASAGEVFYGGQAVQPSPERAIAAGIGLVHQHFMLVPRLTVAENIVLGREPRRLGVLFDRERAEEETRALSVKYGLQIDPRRAIEDLSVGEAQRVEILKVLYRGARCLLLDEPTAVLTPGEATRMLAVLRDFLDRDVEQQRGLLIVTHKLDEVMQIADRAVVMRAGRVVASYLRADFNAQEIARAMVGREVTPIVRQVSARLLAQTGTTARLVTTPALELRDLRLLHDGVQRLRGVSLTVQPGEIVGIAGVDGNGQTELCAAVAGLLPVQSGQVLLAGHEVTRASVQARKQAGLQLVPEDRHRHGLVLDFTLAENLLLGYDEHYRRGLGLLDQVRLQQVAEQLLHEHDVRPADPGALARSLSGGNQQKLVLARALFGGGVPPKVLVAAQPTRGVDLGAVEAIHRALLAARDRGCAILLVSAELDELRTLCDRIAVLYRGELLAELKNPPTLPASRERLGELMAGVA